ncbi:MAG: preprotein translocase subunit YajC [Clostridia bacterium]|nr:preprotein translocase subunit YajC [Clostridia bacterium]
MDLLFKVLEEEAATGKTSSWGTILMMVALFAIMYFMMIRPQKKKQKEEQEMRDAIQIGDEITTIGGICGRVVTVKEDSLVIETGADRNKMKITRWAIQTNNTADDRIQAERAAQEAAKAAEKEAKGKGRRKKKSDVHEGDETPDASNNE